MKTFEGTILESHLLYIDMSKRPPKKQKTRVIIAEPSVNNEPSPLKLSSEAVVHPAKSDQIALVSHKHPSNHERRQSVKFQVMAGSYERILYGLQIQEGNSDSSELLQIKPIFTFPAHISCIKAVAASPKGGKWLATGGTDETIKIWDLRRRKELGGLQQHTGEPSFSE